MNLSHIEQLGIAVKSIPEAQSLFESMLGLACYCLEKDVNQKELSAYS